MKQLLLASILLAAACGSKSSTSGTTTGPDETAAPAPTGPLAAGQWETLDGPSRGRFMKTVVLPHMTGVFKEFPDEFGAEEIDCTTCHGSGANQGQFEMPNAELPALNGEMIMNPDADHKAITEFMATRVRPEMAKLLGKPEWSPEVPDGFGCFGCHPMKQ